MRHHDFTEEEVNSWENIVSIDVGPGVIYGVQANGYVIALGRNNAGQLNVDDWQDVVAIFSSTSVTAGLKSDGTVLLAGRFESNLINEVSTWTDIVSIRFLSESIYGIKSDGTAVFAGRNYQRNHDFENLTNIRTRR